MLKKVEQRLKSLWEQRDYRSHKQEDLYIARRLMESRITESAAYCYNILLAQLYINSEEKNVVLLNHSVFLA
jgi:hypothetical protein